VVITEVRIKLCEANSERLLAFCSVTFDNAFVVRDLKIIEGTKGIFVAMPSRKLTDRCMKCSCKNHLRARFCNSCGARLDESRAMRDTDGRAKLHADIAHPIHSAAREQIQGAVIKAYTEEKERAKMPGYICTYDDYDYDPEDVPVSYGSVVSDVTRGTKAHGPHAAPKGTHFHTDAPAAKSAAKTGDDFGAGIM
jgi:stage V sporulation protein G